MSETDIAFAGISIQAQMLMAGALTSSDPVGMDFKLIERIDPHLNAFCEVRATEALAEAGGCDVRLAAAKKLSLRGVPVAIKERAQHHRGGSSGRDGWIPHAGTNGRRSGLQGALRNGRCWELRGAPRIERRNGAA